MKTTDIVANKTIATSAFVVTPCGVYLKAKPHLDLFIQEFGTLRTAHNALLWCLGDMVLIGRMYWPEEWYQAVVETGYEQSYLDNLARCCEVYAYKDRHHSGVVSFSNYRTMCPKWIPHEYRLATIDDAAKYGWTRPDFEREKFWLFKELYFDMPYQPHYTRDPQAAWHEWDKNGGREAWLGEQKRPPARERLQERVVRARSLANMKLAQYGGEAWQSISDLLDEIFLISEELKA